MRKSLLVLVLVVASLFGSAQKIDGIFFNLYTDSLKKGFYNYISVDGRTTAGQWLPLDTNHLVFSSNTGFFKGNDLFIDSTYKGDSVIVKAALRSNPTVWKETTIYIRRRGFDEVLKTNEQILNDMRNNSGRRRRS